MHKTSDPRISQILPTVTCSDCGLPVELRKLGEHVCSSAPPLPPLKAPAVPAKTASAEDSQDKLSLPFLEKYSKMTGKAMTSLRNAAAAAAPSLSEGLYKTVASRAGTHNNNSSTNEQMRVDTPPSTSPQDIDADPKKSYFPESYERRPSNTSSASAGTRRNNSGDDYHSSNRYFKDTRGIDPILEEDNYNPTPSRSARIDRQDDVYSHKPLSTATSTSRKKPFFLGNLSQENINQTRKNSYSSYRRSDDDDDDYYTFEDETSSPSTTNHGFSRHDTSPSRSSSGDEVNSPRTPGSISYKDDSGFYNSRFNLNDSRPEPKPTNVTRPSVKNKPDTDVLDSMMADLMKDVSGDFDVTPVPVPTTKKVAPKPLKLLICTICKSAINGKDLIYNNDRKPCHPECLSCTLCRAELGDRIPYFEFEKQIYCERDYKVVSRRVICAACDHPIASNAKSIKALGGQYHAGHLKCHHCREPVDKETTGVVEHKGRVFCKYDFKDLYLPKCTACRKPVEREAVSAVDGKLKGKWHRECFGCHTCRRPFPNNTFYVFDSLPYCKRHYHRLNNSLCRQCDEPIEGPCAQTAEGWRFHPPCFTCQVCRCAITDIYYMLENQIYCETHIGHMQRKKNMRAEKRRTQFGRI